MYLEETTAICKYRNDIYDIFFFNFPKKSQHSLNYRVIERYQPLPGVNLIIKKRPINRETIRSSTYKHRTHGE